MKKSYLFLAAIASIALVSCSDEEYLGENNPNHTSFGIPNAINFGTAAKKTTRADDHVGADAATLLNNNFVFAGTKGTSPTTFVFDQYQANWVTNTANTTESNSNDWEYVGYEPVVTTTLPDGAIQSIKYWDYSESQYDFAAYSSGKSTAIYGDATLGTGKVKVSAIDKATKSYTITGAAADLKECYISDLVTVYNYNGGTANDASDDVSDYGKPVLFKFRSLGTKVRLAFYETVPGYSVKDVKFYTSASAELATNGTESDPTLYASSEVLPSGSGTMTITFPTTGWDNRNATDYNKAHVSFAQASGVAAASTLVFEDLDDKAAAEKNEAVGNIYLGRESNHATFAGGLVDADNDNATPETGKYYTILPNETGANLMLRIKYTLVSTDGSGEEITVDNATAVVPAELAQWNPNYAYTYIFKISDMTNGSTGVDGSGNVTTGLTPITLNAVVVDSEDGIQETITTVSKPSITTYTNGTVVTANDEYRPVKTIYLIVTDGTNNLEYAADKFILYTAEVQGGAVQGITEASVANAFEHGTYDDTEKTYTVTDAKGKKLVLTKTSGLLSASTQIEADDSPTGNLITVNGAKFTPANPEYTAGTPSLNPKDEGFYEESGESYVKTNDETPTDGKTYYTKTTGSGTYVFQYYLNAPIYFTQAECDTYNATLDGHLTTAALTAEQAVAYNTAINAKLDGAIAAGAELTDVQVALVNTKLSTSYTEGQKISADDAASYNATLDGAVSKVADDTLSDAEANAYNATLAGARSTANIKEDSGNQFKIIKVVE